MVRKRNYCALLQEKSQGNEQMPQGNGWLTMHIMEALVRIHLVILMITFTFNLIGKHETETSAAHTLHLCLIHTSHDTTLAVKTAHSFKVKLNDD